MQDPQVAGRQEPVEQAFARWANIWMCKERDLTNAYWATLVLECIGMDEDVAQNLHKTQEPKWLRSAAASLSHAWGLPVVRWPEVQGENGPTGALLAVDAQGLLSSLS